MLLVNFNDQAFLNFGAFKIRRCIKETSIKDAMFCRADKIGQVILIRDTKQTYVELPDRTIRNFRSSESSDRRFWTT